MVALQYGGIFTTQKQVPKGHMWIEGDNASRSRDSRDFGPIPYGLVRGRALCKVLAHPPSRALIDIHGLDLAPLGVWHLPGQRVIWSQGDC